MARTYRNKLLYKGLRRELINRHVPDQTGLSYGYSGDCHTPLYNEVIRAALYLIETYVITAAKAIGIVITIL